MQVGDLPLVFELSGVHTPPIGGGDRHIRTTILTHPAYALDRMLENQVGGPPEFPRGQVLERVQKPRWTPPPSQRANQMKGLEGLDLLGRKEDRGFR